MEQEADLLSPQFWTLCVNDVHRVWKHHPAMGCLDPVVLHGQKWKCTGEARWPGSSEPEPWEQKSKERTASPQKPWPGDNGGRERSSLSQHLLERWVVSPNFLLCLLHAATWLLCAPLPTLCPEWEECPHALLSSLLRAVGGLDEVPETLFLL